MTPEQLRLETQRHAAALASLKPDDPFWQALSARFQQAITDANDYATHPDTDEDKRAGWAGRERGLRDLWQELIELQNGEYKQWPELRREAAGRKEQDRE
jgi:hypothetical protein